MAMALAVGFTMPFMQLTNNLEPALARASQYCGAQGNADSFSGINIRMDVYAGADPACTGVRSVEYDVEATSSITIDVIGISLARAWQCGTLYYYLGGVGYTNANLYPMHISYNTPHSCGFQSDGNGTYYEASIMNTTLYANW